MRFVQFADNSVFAYRAKKRDERVKPDLLDFCFKGGAVSRATCVVFPSNHETGVRSLFAHESDRFDQIPVSLAWIQTTAGENTKWTVSSPQVDWVQSPEALDVDAHGRHFQTSWQKASQLAFDIPSQYLRDNDPQVGVAPFLALVGTVRG
jgi:hypothetical protein